MTDRAIVVTGASTGIGRECVRLLAAEGYRVFAGVRTSQDAQALLQEVPRGLTPVFLDVTDAASIRAAFQTVSQELKDGLFGLVNNAGITVAGPLEVLPIDALRRQIEVNVIGTVAVTQAFLPLLRKAGGRIVLMGSILGRVALPFVGAYSISKFALEAVADSLGMELAGSGVSVSLMEPGNIATPIWAKSKQGFLDTTNDAPGMALYRARMESFGEVTDRFAAGGIPPVAVARAVAGALRARRPRARYLVGPDARWAGRAAPLAPSRLRYWIIRRFVLRAAARPPHAGCVRSGKDSIV